MEDFKIIIYILAAVAYFLITQWRKAFKGGEEQEDDVDEAPARPRQRQQPDRPVTSIEDILRELQPELKRAHYQGQEVVQQAKEKAREISQPVAPPMAKPPKYKNYDDIAPKVLSWEKKAEAIEAAKNSKLRREESFKAYEINRPKANRYAEILRNPASARDAFVLSEIFNRKYK